MKRIVLAGLVAAVCSPAFWLTPAGAQERCPEGRTASGACVNAPLALVLRQIGIIFSQPKISQTAYPVLPSGDRRYRYPNQPNPDPSRPTPCCGPPVP
jgi:hypothetical protein